MNVNRTVMINDNNPVERLRNFLNTWWDQAGLTAMLAPVEVSENGKVFPLSIEARDDLKLVNPYVPFLPNNTAAMIDEFLVNHPTGRLAVMLRPCELRTLIELQKRRRIPLSLDERNEDRIVIIGVDCPGTFPEEEFQQRFAKSGRDAMVQEALTYGLDNSPSPRQIRTACQICSWPAPMGADMTIGSLGVTPLGYFLIIARDEIADAALHLAQATDSLAAESQVLIREMTVGAISDQRTHTMASFQADMDNRIGDISDLLACLARCTLCADCLDACPLYNGELSSMLGVRGDERRNRPLLSELVGLSRWLVSCSGCGLCQDACEQDVSLAMLISALSYRIRQELHYPAGDPRQPLPWERPHAVTR